MYYEFEFEERQAAIYAGYTWPQYQALVGNPEWVDGVSAFDSKADVIAAYRTAKRLEALQWETDKAI